MTDATSALPSAVMVDLKRLDAVKRSTTTLPPSNRGPSRLPHALWALEVLWAIGPAAYHTTNASPDRERLVIGEMTQDAF
jgi:hypothetical protein